MRKSKFNESQNAAILKEAGAGAAVSDVARKHGIRTATFYAWRSKYGRNAMPRPSSAVSTVGGDVLKLASIKAQRPPPPPPPPPPPEEPPPPLPEELPGGVEAEAMDELRLLPRDWAKLPRLLIEPPWYQAMLEVAAAAAAAPTARVNFLVQACSTSSATA